jgi:hypothetical protein
MNATATITPANAAHTNAARADGADERAAMADAQYMRALERANAVRIARAELKRKVALGTLPAAEVILDCPWEAASMAVGDLLMSQRRWGQTRCRKLLGQIQMSERKTIGSMTERQRRTLAALLAGTSPEARASVAQDGRAPGALALA